MDLQDFNLETLYFNDLTDTAVVQWLAQAAQCTDSETVESRLLQAYQRAPDNLSVLVGLYRHYFYQQRHEDALFIAQQLLACVAPRIDFPSNWRNLRSAHLAQGVMISIGFVRFYLLTLKANGYLQLHLGEREDGTAMLHKVIEMDAADRLGARHLLETLQGPHGDILFKPGQVSKKA